MKVIWDLLGVVCMNGKTLERSFMYSRNKDVPYKLHLWRSSKNFNLDLRKCYGTCWGWSESMGKLLRCRLYIADNKTFLQKRFLCLQGRCFTYNPLEAFREVVYKSLEFGLEPLKMC